MVSKVSKKLIKKYFKTGVDFEVDFGSIVVPFGLPNRTNLVTKMVCNNNNTVQIADFKMIYNFE